MATARQSRRLKKAFLASFREHGNVSRACRAINLHRATLYVWKEHDTDFMLEYEQAEVEATEALESAAYERAVNGVVQETPIFHRGQQIDTVVKTEYSDTLLIFLLKARNPDKYRETIKTQGTVSGPNGGPVEVRQELGQDSLSAVIAAAEKAAIDALYGVASGGTDDGNDAKM